jgi:hypothetical protein
MLHQTQGSSLTVTHLISQNIMHRLSARRHGGMQDLAFSAYPNNPEALKAMSAQAKWRNPAAGGRVRFLTVFIVVIFLSFSQCSYSDRLLS